MMQLGGWVEGEACDHFKGALAKKMSENNIMCPPSSGATITARHNSGLRTVFTADVLEFVHVPLCGGCSPGVD
ncbi:hypothetical protein CEXT_512381 [Caerostris extrusa]|uniref:Uncharacterized protein n=1 Tax=Caerostris extrusa TaxID=172846 RepID=A0AAV4YAC5_CAEEX|nr:hypothetical protein CEXT_512381 [Caerostris extrusa]